MAGIGRSIYMSVLEIQSISNPSFAQRLRAHIAIARLDHSINNLWVVPGILIPLCAMEGRLDRHIVVRLALAALAVTLVACSNYVLNELLDAPLDRLHPVKRNRPAALGLVIPAVAYAQWLAMMAAGVGIGLLVSPRFALGAVALWIMGCVYNLPPLRTRNIPYLDVLTKSANNPLRVLLGWYAVTSVLVPPVSLLLFCWMISCYFVALRRFGDFSEIRSGKISGAFGPASRHSTPEMLLASALFYASAAMLFLGAFIVTYRVELILAFPLIALTMAVFCKLAFKANSALQKPGNLYRDPVLMATLAATVLVLGVLLFVRIPQLERFIKPALAQSGTVAFTLSIHSEPHSR
jgi:decaprenyl-phosphate phosphoribosyltransferase